VVSIFNIHWLFGPKFFKFPVIKMSSDL
jgi:hypothetical protein